MLFVEFYSEFLMVCRMKRSIMYVSCGSSNYRDGRESVEDYPKVYLMTTIK
jgi:hypothetical protein